MEQSNDLTTAYWLFSALAQSFAALTALTGLFAVYKLQSISTNKADILAHFVYRFRRARDECAKILGPAVEYLSRIDDEPVAILGDHGWIEAVDTYESECKDKLAKIEREFGPPQKQWAAKTRGFFQRLSRQHDAATRQERICTNWAVGMTVFNGLVTILSLVLIPLVPTLQTRLALVTTLMVILAGLALVFTLIACVRILKTGQTRAKQGQPPA